MPGLPARDFRFRIAGGLLLCALAVGCGKDGEKAAQPAPEQASASATVVGQAPAAPGYEPPACEDQAQSITKLTYTFNTAERLEGQAHRTIASVKNVRQLSYGKSPPSLNQYAAANEAGVNSRYCQAELVFTDSSTETVYWRLDAMKNNEIHFDHCSAKHDQWMDQCAAFRIGQ